MRGSARVRVASALSLAALDPGMLRNFHAQGGWERSRVATEEEQQSDRVLVQLAGLSRRARHLKLVHVRAQPLGENPSTLSSRPPWL